MFVLVTLLKQNLMFQVYNISIRFVDKAVLFCSMLHLNFWAISPRLFTTLIFYFRVVIFIRKMLKVCYYFLLVNLLLMFCSITVADWSVEVSWEFLLDTTLCIEWFVTVTENFASIIHKLSALSRMFATITSLEAKYAWQVQFI